ncbi:MAG TPA: transglycosylase SLT domain-containing protein [Longimicrobium sp.]|jgi:membrane-bound lytic murein transglycosylase D|uniref:lytic transglycosylase domain-containing protein n=1 Tax=Longimicrobium sp. TaxID=2029185 RepID=UPI002EDBB668
MEFRSALPVAVLIGCVLGAASADRKRQDGPEIAAAAAQDEGFVSEAAAAVTDATWDIPVVRNAPVQRFVTLFSRRQQDRMALYLKRSGRYEGMIRGKLRERGMPEDLLYLSMIESGFNPTARSHAQAVGLWQFIEGTGERYGLRVDGYVDERRHPEKSTDAALRYLTDLHGQFGSWYLAAAAYNTGENRVARAMRDVTGKQRGRDADFWRIRSRLPRETREYVPLMVAAALIGKEPHKYGMGTVKRWVPLEWDEVQVPAGTRLSTVAEAVGVGEAELKRMNPHLVRSMTPPGKKAYPVRVPQGRVERYAANFAQVQQVAAARAQAEARQVAARRAVERQVAVRKAAERRVASRKAAQQRQVAARRTSRVRRHTVRRGESLWTIARRNNTSVNAVRRANGMGARSRIRPGQRLVIPS